MSIVDFQWILSLEVSGTDGMKLHFIFPDTMGSSSNGVSKIGIMAMLNLT